MLRKRDVSRGWREVLEGGGRGCQPRAMGTSWKRQGAEGPSFHIIWGPVGILARDNEHRPSHALAVAPTIGGGCGQPPSLPTPNLTLHCVPHFPDFARGTQKLLCKHLFIYLFGCAGSWLRPTGSPIFTVA